MEKEKVIEDAGHLKMLMRGVKDEARGAPEVAHPHHHTVMLTSAADVMTLLT